MAGERKETVLYILSSLFLCLFCHILFLSLIYWFTGPASFLVLWGCSPSTLEDHGCQRLNRGVLYVEQWAPLHRALCPCTTVLSSFTLQVTFSVRKTSVSPHADLFPYQSEEVSCMFIFEVKGKFCGKHTQVNSRKSTKVAEVCGGGGGVSELCKKLHLVLLAQPGQTWK